MSKTHELLNKTTGDKEMKKSSKLYSGGMIVELVAILLSLAYVSLPLNIFLFDLSSFPHLNILPQLAATVVFLMGILCVTFGRRAEKSETWFRKVSIVFSAYERAKARVA
jgi:hypothetical protein